MSYKNSKRSMKNPKNKKFPVENKATMNKHSYEVKMPKKKK